MVTRISHIQHHLWVDIWCMKQSSRLPIPIGRGSQQSSNCQHPHQLSCHISNRWTCHSHPQQNESINECYATWYSITITTGYHQIKCTCIITRDCKDTLLQMQRTDPFCKDISKQLLNGKAPHHKADAFTNINSLLYKHAMDATQKFLALVIPKSWHFTVFSKAHDKLGHRVNRTYHLIKWHYYW